MFKTSLAQLKASHGGNPKSSLLWGFPHPAIGVPPIYGRLIARRGAHAANTWPEGTLRRKPSPGRYETGRFMGFLHMGVSVSVYEVGHQNFRQNHHTLTVSNYASAQIAAPQPHLLETHRAPTGVVAGGSLGSLGD